MEDTLSKYFIIFMKSSDFQSTHLSCTGESEVIWEVTFDTAVYSHPKVLTNPSRGFRAVYVSSHTCWIAKDLITSHFSCSSSQLSQVRAAGLDSYSTNQYIYIASHTTFILLLLYDLYILSIFLDMLPAYIYILHGYYGCNLFRALWHCIA